MSNPPESTRQRRCSGRDRFQAEGGLSSEHLRYIKAAPKRLAGLREALLFLLIRPQKTRLTTLTAENTSKKYTHIEEVNEYKLKTLQNTHTHMYKKKEIILVASISSRTMTVGKLWKVTRALCLRRFPPQSTSSGGKSTFF